MGADDCLIKAGAQVADRAAIYSCALVVRVVAHKPAMSANKKRDRDAGSTGKRSGERDRGQRPISSFFFSKPKAAGGAEAAAAPAAPSAPLLERKQVRRRTLVHCVTGALRYWEAWPHLHGKEVADPQRLA